MTALVHSQLARAQTKFSALCVSDASQTTFSSPKRGEVLVLSYPTSGKLWLVFGSLYFGATAVFRIIEHSGYSFENFILIPLAVITLLASILMSIEAIKRVEYRSESIDVSWLFGIFLRTFSLNGEEVLMIKRGM